MTCPSASRHDDRRARQAPRRCGSALLLPALLALSLLAPGCEEDVVAVLGTDRPFTLFGVLTPQLDTQWVRVFPIESVLEPGRAGPLDARFRSLDLTAGEERRWQDSLLREPNGEFAHVFWAPFTASFGHTYRIEVTRSDGATTDVTVTVPPRSELVLPERSLATPPLFPVHVAGQVPNLIRIEVVYTFVFRTVSDIRRDKATFSYQGAQQRTPDGWLIQLNVARDTRIILELLKEQYLLDPRNLIKIIEVQVRMIAANEAWDPPGGVFDPELLVQPGVMSNVRNGFGFVGAGYRLSARWVPFDTLLTKAASLPGF
ncbi:MAG: hypothetical protein KatS3mg043_0254 [Rhodothermaceae bacterium]|nr:MAG: hypothetical protein KatS3mg043_0254 [Rhodothermaceae bacterium]